MVISNSRVLFPRLVWLAIIGLAIGCGDLLTVSDPGRFTSEDLDESLEAVARGVEGDFALGYSEYVVAMALLADEYRDTGTWVSFRHIDWGRVEYGNSAQSNTALHPILRARWAAQAAADRFARVLGEAEALRSPLTVQVRSLEAWTNLILAQGWCEAALEPLGEPRPDTEVYQQAVAGFTAALALAEGLGLTEWIHFNRAGRARAHLMLENFAEARSDAQQVPDGFIKYALYSSSSVRQYNTVVRNTTYGVNKQAGIREKWWGMVDDAAGMLIDPWTGELDPRVPIVHRNEIGTNAHTPHYSQYKYTDLGSDIPMTHSGEMRLIEAEVAWRNGDLDQALGLMNHVRGQVGLSPLPATDSPTQVFDYLLHERFAQMFMEGNRAADLHRLNLVRDMSVEVDGQEVFGAGRPTKFPISQSEIVATPGAADDTSVRCLPRA